jgi:hypothetical protein
MGRMTGSNPTGIHGLVANADRAVVYGYTLPATIRSGFTSGIPNGDTSYFAISLPPTLGTPHWVKVTSNIDATKWAGLSTTHLTLHDGLSYCDSSATTGNGIGCATPNPINRPNGRTMGQMSPIPADASRLAVGGGLTGQRYNVHGYQNVGMPALLNWHRDGTISPVSTHSKLVHVGVNGGRVTTVGIYGGGSEGSRATGGTGLFAGIPAYTGPLTNSTVLEGWLVISSIYLTNGNTPP